MNVLYFQNGEICTTTQRNVIQGSHLLQSKNSFIFKHLARLFLEVIKNKYISKPNKITIL